MKLLKLFISFTILTFAFALSADATDLFISEYVEGSSYHKAIEIYNGTGAAIDLSSYSLKKQTNGSGDFGSELVLEGNLANDDVFVVANNQSDVFDTADYVDLLTGSQSLNFNGNDAVALCYNGNPVDIIGVVDSSDDWGKDVTLVRNSAVFSPTLTYTEGEWTSFDQNTFDNLGFHVFSGGSTDPMINISAPSSSTEWEQGSSQSITWSTLNYEGSIKIELYIGGSYGSALVESTEDDGEWTWDIPADLALGTDYSIKVSDPEDGDPHAYSADFSIIEPVQVMEKTIYEIQYTEDASGDSPYVDQLVQTSGVVTAVFYNGFFIQDGAGEWNGVFVYDVTCDCTVGDFITLQGTIAEYNGKTEIIALVSHQIEDPQGVPSPAEISTNTVAISESYEGVLVEVTATCTNDSLGYGEWEINDGSGACRVDDIAFAFIPNVGVTYNVIGIVDYAFGSYRILPRFETDITIVTENNDLNQISSINHISCYPNPFAINANTRNQTLNIKFNLESQSDVSIDVYNIMGQKIAKVLDNRPMKSGINNIEWNCTSSNKEIVSTGIYFMKISTESFSKTQKILICK